MNLLMGEFIKTGIVQGIYAGNQVQNWQAITFRSGSAGSGVFEKFPATANVCFYGYLTYADGTVANAGKCTLLVNGIEVPFFSQQDSKAIVFDDVKVDNGSQDTGTMDSPLVFTGYRIQISGKGIIAVQNDAGAGAAPVAFLSMAFPFFDKSDPTFPAFGLLTNFANQAKWGTEDGSMYWWCNSKISPLYKKWRLRVADDINGASVVTDFGSPDVFQGEKLFLMPAAIAQFGDNARLEVSVNGVDWVIPPLDVDWTSGFSTDILGYQWFSISGSRFSGFTGSIGDMPDFNMGFGISAYGAVDFGFTGVAVDNGGTESPVVTNDSDDFTDGSLRLFEVVDLTHLSSLGVPASTYPTIAGQPGVNDGCTMVFSTTAGRSYGVSSQYKFYNNNGGLIGSWTPLLSALNPGYTHFYAASFQA